LGAIILEDAMTAWKPIAVLPNLSIDAAIDGGVIAFAPVSDPRVLAACAAVPKFADFLSRFTDAFGVRLEPAMLIIRTDAEPLLSGDALLSFRDLVAMSVIPYCRSLSTVYGTTHRIVYSNTFWIFPWTLSNDSRFLVMSSPALNGTHVVEQFGGQSTPEMPIVSLKDFDKALFDALLTHWKRHYLGKRKRWRDRALFRSLNMAFQAAALPAGVGTNMFDLGRSISLWVSALEILSHPGDGKAGLDTVYPLFEKLAYCDSKVGARRYAAYHPGKKKKVPKRRSPLPCWMYGKLFEARNHFLHGNRVTARMLSPKGSKDGLFWLAPPLYRLGLGGFLDLVVETNLPYWLSEEGRTPEIRRKRDAHERQHMVERALLRILHSK
jgi:hypothetical protein